MSRLVAKDGGPDGYDYCQLVKTPEGKLIFPDEQGAAVIAQALLSGKIFHRILDRNLIDYTKQPRRVKIIVGISHSEADSTGTNYYAAYSESKHPQPPLVLNMTDEIKNNPAISQEHDGPRKLTSVRKHRASRADFSPALPREESQEKALTHNARVLMDLINYGDELLAAMIPDSVYLKNAKVQSRVTTFTPHQSQKLSGGFDSETITDEYTVINSLIQSLNTLAARLFSPSPDSISW